MFGCEACVTTRAPPGIGPTTEDPWTFESAFPAPTKKGAEMFAEEYKPVRVPRLVMFGCAACVTTRAEFALRTFPETENPWTFERAFPVPIIL
jgi:hypothetical protein